MVDVVDNILPLLAKLTNLAPVDKAFIPPNPAVILPNAIPSATAKAIPTPCKITPA